MAEKLALRASFPVHTYEVDAFGTLEVPALSGYLQEVAGLHAGELGVGSTFSAGRGSPGSSRGSASSSSCR